MIKRLLFWTFLYTPDPVLDLCLSVVAGLRSIGRILVHREVEIELFEGHRDGCPVSLAWAGPAEQRKRILDTLYDDAYRVTRRIRARRRGFDETLARVSASCDLVCVERNRWLPALRGFDRIEPALLTRMGVDELGDPASPNSTRSRRRIYHRKMKLIENSGVEFREFPVSRRPDLLRMFYDRLYAPHISSTHGRESVETFDSMKIFYAKGILRLAYLDGEVISGTLFLHRGDTLTSCKYGVRDAGNRLDRATSSVQSYLGYAKDRRARYFSAFHVRPFFEDGGFRAKRMCGLSVYRDRRNYYGDTDLYLRVLRYSPGVVGFLNENPFIFVADGKLVASLLCRREDAGLVDEIVDEYRRRRTGGIARYRFHIGRQLTASERREACRRIGLPEESDRLAWARYERAPRP